MENATDALIMMASVLLLVVALTVNISSFSTIKNQMDEILSQEDTVDRVTQVSVDGKQEYINYYKSENDIRIVDASTVMTSIRRTNKENYNVYLCPTFHLC